MPVNTGVVRLSLASASTPAIRTSHGIIVRCRVTSGSGAYIRASLYEGAIDRTGIIEQLITTTLTTYQLVINDVAAATIGNYSNLELRIWGYQPTGSGLTFQIADVYLSIPLAPSSSSHNGAAALPLNFNAATNGQVIGASKTTGVARVSLAAGDDPVTNSAHSIAVRARAYSGTGNLKVALYEGATNRSGDLTSGTLTTSLADYQFAIPDANAANITDYSNLELRIWGVSTAGASFDVARAVLQLPAVAGGITTVGLATETSSTLAVSVGDGSSVVYPSTGIYPSESMMPGVVTVGIATETSSASAIFGSGTADQILVGIATETSEAMTLPSPVVIVVTIPQETSSALATTFQGGSAVIVVGIAIERNLTGRTTGSGDIITRSVILDRDTDLVIGAQTTLDPFTLRPVSYTNYLEGVVDGLAILGGAISDREVADLWSRITHNGTDGYGYNSSTGLWGATTNLVLNGGFEVGVTGWSAVSGASLSQSSDACFGTGALRIAASGSGQGATLSSSVVTTVSQTHTGSAWVKGSGVVRLELEERTAADAVVGTTNGTNFGLEGTWQRLTVSRAFGATGARARLRVIGQSAISTILVDGAQLEQSPAATPYVETNGVSETRNGALVQASSGYVNESQGWVAARIRVGWDTATSPEAFPTVFSWTDNANNGLLLYYSTAAQQFSIDREALGVTTQQRVSKTLVARERVTVIAAWTASGVKLSINGAPFAITAGANIPALTSTLFEIGGIGAGTYLNGDIIWFSSGVGTLTDNDARVLHDWNDEPPRLHTYSAASLVRFAWDGVDDYGLEANFTHPLSTGKLRRIFHHPGSKRGATELELIDDMERLQTEQGVLSPVVTGEYMGEAISRILKKIGMEDPSMWDLDDGEPGLTRVQNLGDVPWLSLIVDIVTSDYGIFLIDAEGRAVFRERRSRPLAPYRGRLSRELHALEPGVDLDRIVNTWAVTAADQPEAVDSDNYPTGIATFQRSYRRYGIRMADRTALHLSTQNQAYSLAEHLVRRSADPDAPVYAVSLSNRTDRQLALALSLRIGDMIEIFGKQTIGHYIVEQIDVEMNAVEGRHEAALIVSAP